MAFQAVIQFFVSRQPVTLRAMFTVGMSGLCIGLMIGYIMMGSMHAFLEMGVEQHYGHGTPIRAITSGDPEAQSQADQASTVQDDVSSDVIKADTSNWPSKGNKVHTLCTSNGSPYTNFQNRIMYGTYQLSQKEPGGDVLAGFTRILHRTVPDELMQEIPTFHAKPLTPQCDNWCPFPVADRPNAVRQFFEAAAKDPSLIKAPWILLIETDYVWMRPLQNVPAVETGAPGWAFSYGYIIPTYPSIEGVMRSLFPESKGPLSKIPTTGPAPIMMRAAEWLRVVPDWERLTAHVESNEIAKQQLGWVREMYAFSIAVALQDVKLEVRLPPSSPLMVQPPADHKLGAAALCHYTWGAIFKDTLQNDTEVWKFDKRFYTAKETALKIPQLELPPAWREGLTLQDKAKVSPELITIMTSMIHRMNAGTEGLPDLSPHS